MGWEFEFDSYELKLNLHNGPDFKLELQLLSVMCLMSLILIVYGDQTHTPLKKSCYSNQTQTS